MGKLKVIKREQMNEISKYIWKSFDIVRGEIPANDYDVILFLITAYKDSIIELQEVLYPLGLLQELKEDINKSSDYSQILPEYLHILERIDPIKLNELFAHLGQIDRRRLSDNFETIFEDLLFQLSEYQKKGFGQIMQPKEVSRFMMNLADLKDGSKVYNPFAGLASYSLFLNNSHTYHGQEYNRQTWALGKLRMFAHKKNDNTIYQHEDSIKKWNDADKFDLIISSPPFRMPISREYSSIFTKEPYKRVESFLIDQGIHSLNGTGKLITLLPQGFLFASGGSERKFKEALVLNDLIDSVISLPQGLLSNTGVSLCIVVFKMASSRPGFVKFVDGSEFFQKDNNRTRNNILLDKDLMKVIHQDKEGKSLKYVPSKEIERNNYDLSVSRYFALEVEGYKLKSFTTVLLGERPEPNLEGKFIRIRDLKDDVIDNHLEIEKIENSKIPNSGVRKIQESCLLLATRWNTMKPTYFEYTGEPIFLRPDILCLKVDSSKVSIGYLMNELNSDYVTEQVNAFRTGATIPYIRKEDLKNIKIQFPAGLNDPETKRKQSDVVSAIKDSIQRSRLKEAGLLKELEDFKRRYKEELESKQHNIRQHLKNVNDSVMVLRRFMELNNGVLKADDVINERRNITVERRFDALKNSLDQVIVEINNITNDLNFGPSEKLPLIKAIKSCIEEQGDLQNFHFEFEVDEIALQEAKIKDPKINFSRNAFKEVFNNIVENAKRHGFIDSSKNYFIEISLTIQDNHAILEFLNNGKPWPKGLVSKLGTKGVKAGISANKGIGIWRIFETIKHYGGEYEIIDQPEETFPVGFKFMFELNENSNEEI